MAFTLPDFNLAVSIFTGPYLTRVLRVNTVGNLAWSKRAGVAGDLINTPDPQINSYMTLLLPPLTDVRNAYLYGEADVLEVPSGSGRWYTAAFIDDIGKGFANEHRGVLLCQISQYFDPIKFAGLFWPEPMP